MTGASGRSPPDDSWDEDETVRARFDFSETAPSTAVVETVGIAANCEPTALERMASAIDPDALDAIFGPASPPADDDTSVTFAYTGYLVTVRGNGEVAVRTEQL